MTVNALDIDIISWLRQYEAGRLEYDQTIELFQYLIDKGTYRHMAEHYRKTAHLLIDSGQCQIRAASKSSVLEVKYGLQAEVDRLGNSRIDTYVKDELKSVVNILSEIPDLVKGDK